MKNIIIRILIGLVFVTILFFGMHAYEKSVEPKEFHQVTMELYFVGGQIDTRTYTVPVGTKFMIVSSRGSYRLAGSYKSNQVFGEPGVTNFKIK